ncbi:MAG TPA: Gfo/Idh/MocA family oxidoreductase [Bacteroidales bacterium]|nr:Gfo/Idh/MocA family oxidoreductase [Bacteroidales bacterium]
MRKIRWGVLSTAKIGREKVIPALQASLYCDVRAIASRNLEQAEMTAKQLNISKAYSSYEELLNDPDIEAVYIPLPNHLHVEWAIKALEAGKHVLCEKPIGISAEQAEQLLNVSQQKPNLKMMEAFMYRFHPQWQLVKRLVEEGKIGTLKMVQSHFSYYNVEPKNIRNSMEAHGGALMDIGCYCISFARFLFNEEPCNVMGSMDRDPVFKTDRITSGILDFSTGKSIFTCSTQMMPYQRVNILGTEARIEIEIPVNAPLDKPTHVWIHTKDQSEEIRIEPINQYTLQGDYFSLAILNDTTIQPGLQDAVNNMKVIDALVKSASH